MLTKRIWCAQLKKYIGWASNDESKPLKSMYFVSDACTYEILEVLNSFAMKSSSQNNDKK